MRPASSFSYRIAARSKPSSSCSAIRANSDRSRTSSSLDGSSPAASTSSSSIGSSGRAAARAAASCSSASIWSSIAMTCRRSAAVICSPSRAFRTASRVAVPSAFPGRRASRWMPANHGARGVHLVRPTTSPDSPARPAAASSALAPDPVRNNRPPISAQPASCAMASRLPRTSGLSMRASSTTRAGLSSPMGLV